MSVSSSNQPPTLFVVEPMAPTPSKEYFCDGCLKTIPAESPRVHCLTCPDHDLCANCALGERFGRDHTGAHPTTIYSISGDTTLFAVRSKAKLTYASSFLQQHGVSASSDNAFFGGTSSLESTNVGNTNYSLTFVNTSFPGTHLGASISPRVAPDGWSRFFDADMNPTPTFLDLTSAVFTHLDPAGTGFLLPDAYSQLLDDMGFPTQENVWKSNLGHPQLAQTSEAPADAALKQAFDLLGIPHTLQERLSTAGTASPENETQLNLFQLSAPPPGPMPLLSPPALASLLAIEMLTDPSAAYSRLGHLLRLYGLDGVEPWRRWGAMPRGVLPEAPDARMVERVAAVGAQIQGGNGGAQNQAGGSGNSAAINAIGGGHRHRAGFSFEL